MFPQSMVQKFCSMFKLAEQSLVFDKKMRLMRLDVKDLKYLPYLNKLNYTMQHCDQSAIYLNKNGAPETNHGCYVGAGAIVVHNDNILLVQERNGFMKELWGVPAGLVDQGEKIQDGCVREVFEETNLRIFNLKIIFIREVDKTFYNLPNIFFCFRAQTTNISNASYCQKELMGMQWVPIQNLNEFRQQNKLTSVSSFALDAFQAQLQKSQEVENSVEFKIFE